MENPGGENPDEENPDEENPDEENPDGENPDEENPDEENPDEENPDEENPDGENPDEENPDEENPDEENPDEENPDEEEPAVQTYQVTVSFGMHGEGENYTLTVKEGEMFRLPVAPTAEKGYLFAGWYCKDRLLEEDFLPTEDISIEAHYTLIEYTITYQAEGVTIAPTNYTVESGNIELPSPEKKGYTFAGWKDADGNAVTVIDVSAAKDMTLYAEFSIIEYTITYQAEGITIAPTKFTVESMNVELPSPEKKGYAFAGWKDADGNAVTDIDVSAAKDMTLYAEFSLVEYTITYQAEGVTIAPTKYTVESGNVELPSPEKKGYTFAGWKDADGNAVTGIDVSAAKDMTLYAEFSLIEYTITYQAEGVTIAPTQYTVESENVELPSPEKKGYAFVGWKDADGNAVTGIDVSAAKDMTLYAEFSLIEYTITYDLDGGKTSEENPSEYTVETPTFTLHNPERENYIFLGWKAEGQEQPQKLVIIEQGTAGDLKFVAVWEREMHQLIVDGEKVADIQAGSLYLLKVPAREGATFMGWANAEGAPVHGAEEYPLTMGKADIVLYTRWAAHNAIADEEQLLAAISDETAGKIVLSGDITMTRPLVIGRSISLDFAGNALELNAAQGESPMRLIGSKQASISVLIQNGEISFSADDALLYRDVPALDAQFLNLTLENIALFCCGCGIRLADGAFELRFVSVEAGGAYAVLAEGATVRTNATLSDCSALSSLAEGAGLIFASEGALTAERSVMGGGSYGMILRMGNAKVEGGKIYSRGEGSTADAAEFPMAAVIVGDRQAGMYKYNADLSVSGTEMSAEGVGADGICIRLFGDAEDETTAILRCSCSDAVAALYTLGQVVAENDYASIDIDHAAELSYVAEREATCADYGVREHYACPDCGATYIKDEYGTYVPVSEEALLTEKDNVHHFSAEEYSDPVAPTCTEEGTRGYTYCTVCKTYFTYDDVSGEYVPVGDKSELVLDALGHDFEFVYYEEDGFYSLECLHEGCEFYDYGIVLVMDEYGYLFSLKASDFSVDRMTGAITLTLPKCTLTPPDGKEFGGYRLGEVLYQANDTIEVGAGPVIQIIIEWN